ncbi:MAG: GAF domain-containing protein [Anaerolineae bacterium]|nr:GAF domain-containing protein [Anaerolineae bacterium]MDW8173628.1 GAF domain-containing protein [Anaerolineae bacterium]
MSKSALHAALALLLSALAIGSALLNLGQALDALPSSLTPFIVYSLLTAFAIALSVDYGQADLNVAHMVGMVAFLSSSAQTAPLMLWAILVGSSIGGAFFVVRDRLPRRRARADQWMSGLYMLGRTVLPFFLAGQAYMSLGGPLPISLSSLNEALPSLLIFSLLYFGLYLAIFALEIGLQPSSVRSTGSPARSVAALALPIPFAIVAASSAQVEVSLVAFAATSAGIALTIFVIAIISRSEFRLRQQLSELHALQSLNDALRNSLSLDILLSVLHSQAQALFQASDFVVGLLDEHGKLSYPLVVRRAGRGVAPPYPQLIECVIRQQQPWLMSQNVGRQAASQGILIDGPAPTSWMGVPLVAQNVLIGVIALASDDQHFTANDLRFLRLLATHAAIAIDNVRLYNQKSRRAEQLALLNQVSTSLSRSLSTEVLDATVMAAGMISDANAIALSLWQHGRWQFERQLGLSEQTILSPMMNVDEERPSPLIIRDLQQHSVPHPSYDLLVAQGKRAALEVPLMSQDKLLGALAFYYNEPMEWSSDELDMLETFAAQASQAIQNALKHMATDRALEARVEQLLMLAVLGRQLSAEIDLETVCQTLLDRVMESLSLERGALLLWDGQGWQVQAVRGYSSEELRDAARLGRGQLGRTLTEGESLIVNLVGDASDYTPFDPEAQSALISPLLKGSEVLGAVVLEAHSPQAFSEYAAQFVNQMLNQGAIAISNARLFRRVREARDNLQVILNAMEEAIVLLSAEGRVAMANPRVSALGLRPAEILFASVATLLDDLQMDFARRLGFDSPDELEALLALVREDRWQTAPPHHVFYADVQQGGSRIFQRQVLPVRDEQGQLRGLMLVFYDKTEEQELANSRESFTQMLVHDLKSPLAAVTTSLRLVQELVPQDIEHYQLIHKTTETSRRALKTVVQRVDSILDVAKMESGDSYLNREIVALGQLIEAARTEVALLAHELEIGIEVELEDTLPLLDVDGDKVERLILNLLDNALKYSPSESQIRIRAFREDECFVRLMVIDQGQGIPDEFKTRLFDRFVQLHDSKPIARRGVGLGLAFCRLVAEAHGGRIWVEDNPDGGSAFCVLLPCAPLA